MKYLNLNDLEFNALNYREKGEGLRKWLLSSMEFNPVSFLEISKNTGICYRALLNFVNGKSYSMNYKNMSNLKLYIESLITNNQGLSVEDLKDEDFFVDS